MKNLLLLSFYILTQCIPAQSFTWMKGNNLVGSTANYGTLGISNPANNPGCRHGAATWTDSQGNLWLFGGEGFDGTATLCWLNDLWKYDVQTNEWTWMGGANTANQPGVYGTLGVASPTNQPGAREFMMSWIDLTGKLWLFGGDGFDGSNTFGKLADLWRYDPSAGTWAWIKGPNSVDQNGTYGSISVPNPANFPGSRSGSATWTDNLGNLWLMGGQGYPASGSNGHLNDVWCFNTTTQQWYWAKGSNLSNQQASYGTLNTPAAANSPGGLEFPAYWYQSGDLYLFGGRGYASSPSPSYLNAFWKYNLATNQWTWIGGSTGTMQTGSYGVLGSPSPTVYPGSRMSSACWNDGAGYLWLFGGEGVPSSFSLGRLNDLFRYNLLSGEWTWMKGANTLNQSGTYGTQGIPSAGNIPGARMYNSWWPVKNGKGWLIGGQGYGSTGAYDNINDLWLFSASCNPELLAALPSTSVCSIQNITLTALSSNSAAVNWYTTPIGGSIVGSGNTFTTIALLTGSNNISISYYAQHSTCTLYPRSEISLTILATPQLSITGSSTICAGDSYTLNALGSASGYTWSNGSQTSSISGTLTSTSNFSVIGTGSNNCIGQQGVTIFVNPLPQIAIQGSNSVCMGQTLALTATGTALSYSWNNGALTASVSVSPVTTTVYQVYGLDANGCSNSASIHVTVAALPIISIQSKSVICNGESALLVASGANSYTWSTGQISNSINVSPPSYTVYTVNGLSASNCSNTASFSLQVAACLGTTEIDKLLENDFLIYPNPSAGEINIQFGQHTARSISLCNSLGQLLYSKTVTEKLIQLQLPPGVYIFTLTNDSGQSRSAKIIVN